jgi:hypothetical protein
MTMPSNLAFCNTHRRLTWCLVVVLLALATPAVAWAAFPFVDVNNNGRYDHGVDSGDITPQLIAQGGVTTPHSIVFPAGPTELVFTHRRGLLLVAGQNVTINRSIRTSTIGSHMVVLAQQGSITVGGSVALRAPGTVSFSAGQDVVFGPYSTITSRPMWGERSIVNVQAGGDVLVMQGTVLLANQDVQIVAKDAFTAERGSGVVSARGNMKIYGGQGFSGQECILKARLTSIYSEGPLVELRNSQVHAVPGSSVGLYIIARPATVVMTGTMLYGLNGNNVTIEAAQVVR